MKKTYFKIKNFIFLILDMKKLHYYSTRNSYYESLLSLHSNKQFFNNLMKIINNSNKIKTNIEIKIIENKTINEISIKDIIRKYGNSHYKIINKDLLGIKILFFKRKIGKYKTKLEFHFFNKKLFFYTYNFSDLNIEDKNEIKEIIKKKYLVKNFNYIIDKSNTIITLNDNVNFSISYLCNNKIILEKIIKSIDFINGEHKNQKKIYRKILYNEL